MPPTWLRIDYTHGQVSGRPSSDVVVRCYEPELLVERTLR